jgi:hypothetical protein
MDSKSNHFEDLRFIKKIMEESSRFLSLSGLSGVFAGLTALTGGAVAYIAILKSKNLGIDQYFINLSTKEISTLRIQLILDAILVLVLAVTVSLYFSIRKARLQGLKMWTPVSKRLLVNFAVPLVTGGFFIIILYIGNQWHLLVPAMLIFYGLALVNAGKFTYSEIFYLGLIEIVTGLISAIFPGFGIFFWCFGFGILHITYGLFMYRKYEG